MLESMSNVLIIDRCALELAKVERDSQSDYWCSKLGKQVSEQDCSLGIRLSLVYLHENCAWI